MYAEFLGFLGPCGLLKGILRKPLYILYTVSYRFMGGVVSSNVPVPKPKINENKEMLGIK